VTAGIGPLAGPDGQLRCPWAISAAEYVAYHDDEWGVPVRDDRALFERLSLEAFQSGLAWITILRKREQFRVAFAGFDPAVVTRFDDGDRARLMADAGIVRNRAKVDATIANAGAVLELGPGGLTELIWSAVPARPAKAPRTTGDLVGTSPESIVLAKTLKKNGFRFVGPTTAYALMQACGLVDDHLHGCFRRGRRAGDHQVDHQGGATAPVDLG
jgi:DNA-3-methyladenine glycosylase I